MNAPSHLGLITFISLAALTVASLMPVGPAHAESDPDQGAAAPVPGTSAGEVPAASPSGRSTRPGRVGRDGAAVRLPPQETVPEERGPKPSAQETPEPAGTPEDPQPATPTAEPREIEPEMSQAEAYRREQEQRRRQMELQQQQAEEAERARREARMREMMQQQQEAIRKDETLRQMQASPPMPAE